MSIRKVFTLLLVLNAPLGFAGATIPNSTLQYDFLNTGNAEGWSPTHSLSSFTVSNGVLTTQITGSDPYMFGPSVSFSGTAYPYLAIRMKTNSGDNGAELFFATTTSPNFSADKSVVFSILSDNQWHTYLVDMRANDAWNNTIVRYRLDPGNSANSGTVQIDYFMCLSAPPSRMWEFGITGDTEGWTAVHGMNALTTSGGTLRGTITGNDPFLHGPMLDLGAIEAGSLVVDMRVDVGTSAQLFWITSTDPVWSEAKSTHFNIQAGVDFHVYEIPLENLTTWKGTITQLRIDPTSQGNTGQFRINRIWVLPSKHNVQFVTFGPDRSVVQKGETFEIRAEVKNLGTETVSAATLTLTLPPEISLLSADLENGVGSLVPGGPSKQATWSVQASQDPGIRTINVSVDLGGSTPHNTQSARVLVSSPPPDPDSIPATDNAHAVTDASGNMVLQSSRLRAVAVSNPGGFGPIYLYGRSSSGADWLLAGVLSPVGDVILAAPGNPLLKSAQVQPSNAQVLSDNPDSASIRFTSNLLGDLGLNASYRLDLAVSADSTFMQADGHLTASQAVDLYRFAPINLKVGERAYGASQQEALFPGVEWLISGEVSSSTLDIAPPQNLRYAPDPHFVTIPGMGVLTPDNLLAGLVWEATQEWAEGKIKPTALFASPNFLDGQENHRLEIFAPSIPDFVPVNSLHAANPYPMKTGETVHLSTRIVVQATCTTILDLVDQWLDLHGHQPPPYPLPRTLEETVVASREAFLTTLWGEDTKCWQHATGFSCSQTPGFAYLLWLDYLTTGSITAKDRALEAIQYYIQTSGASVLTSQSGLHIFGVQAPFVFGEMNAGINSMVSMGLGQISQLRNDGSYPPFGDPSLYDANDRELGWTARRAYQLLSMGRQLKRADFLNGGKRSLEHMKTFTVPRAAQTWEIPQHTPDLLAAGQAVEAFVAGYEAFGDSSYLDEAIYWARAGLPFLWFWNPPDRTTMRYGSVPVFGATFYTGSWFGKAVQWNGLVYSHALFLLANHDSSYDWRTIAEGVATSGIHQQVVTPGSLMGTYPDGWNMVGNNPQPVYINPEDILKNVYFMLDKSPELTTLQLGSAQASQTGTVLITGLVDDMTVQSFVPGQYISLNIKNKVGETTRLLVAGWTQPVGGNVWEGETTLPKVTNIDTTSEGWQTKSPHLLIRFVHELETETISFGVPPAEIKAWEGY